VIFVHSRPVWVGLNSTEHKMSIRVKNEKCHFCTKSVYAMDRMAADNIVFHKGCMKCEHCGGTLSLGNFASLNGKYYCKPHFKQLFATKGNYSDGFGEDKPTSKWEAKPIVYGSAAPGADFTKPKTSSPLTSKSSTTTPDAPKPAPEPVVSAPEVEVCAAPEPEPEPVQTPQEPEPEAPVEVPAASEVEEPSEPVKLADRMSNFSVEETPKAPAAKAPEVSVTSAAGSPLPPIKKDACVVCGKTVYAMEKMVANGVLFHKNCMKCTHCGKTLGLGNFASLNGKYYCKPHFKQLFATKGNYSDGFGEEAPTAKWEPQAPGYATGGPKNFFTK